MSAATFFRWIRSLLQLLLLVFLAVTPTNSQQASSTTPLTLIGVNLRSPDFQLRSIQFRVFYNKFEAKTVPLSDYDFGAALADEMKTVFSEGKKSAWSVATPEENLFVASYFDVKKKQGNLPPSVKADRLLLLDVIEYGALVGPVDKFYIRAELRLIDRNSGRQIWKKGMFERIDLDGKMEELQADNQRGLKKGINDVLEKFARRAREKMAGAGV